MRPGISGTPAPPGSARAALFRPVKKDRVLNNRDYTVGPPSVTGNYLPISLPLYPPRSRYHVTLQPIDFSPIFRGLSLSLSVATVYYISRVLRSYRGEHAELFMQRCWVSWNFVKYFEYELLRMRCSVRDSYVANLSFSDDMRGI